MRKLLLAITSLCAGFVSYSQMTILDADYVGANQLNCTALSAGGLNFMDMNGNYIPDLDETVTLCPDLTQGTKVSIAFATNIGYEFDIHPSDTLYIYDGPTTAAPLLAAVNSGTNPTGGNWQASFQNNTSGCLTVRFKSDAANGGTGWLAKVACGNLAQPYYPHLEAFVNGDPQNRLNPIDTGYVNVCLGDSILFVAKPLFPYSLEATGFGYSQNVDSLTYNWNISTLGAMNVNNDSLWFVPASRQGFFVDLKMIDDFPQLTGITAKVRVSILPSFATAGPIEDTICLGTTDILVGGVTPQDTAGVSVPGGEFSVGGNFAGLTFLPDGTGQVYETTVNISGLGSGTVTQPSDIASICLDIEHSFIGDLEIAITCPNGTMVSLMNTYNVGGTGELIPVGGCYGGGVFLGSDTDDDGGAPGAPVETYCFSFVNPDFGTVCGSLGNTYSNPTGNDALIPGTYTPDGDFADLVGCPLVGDWTITVQDNQGQDDGYIFQWGIVFDASLYPDVDTYQNYYVDGYWSPSPNIISGQNDTLVVIQTSAPGNSSYTYNVIDDFGCHYDTTFNVYTWPSPIIFPDTLACNFIYNVNGTVAANGGVWSSADTNIHFLPNANVLNPTITSSIPGTFDVTFTDNECGMTITSSIEFINWAYVNAVDTVVCIGGTLVTSCGVYPQNDSYVWSDGTVGHDITVTQGVYIVTASNECNSHSDTMTVDGKVCYITAPNIIVLSSISGNNKFFLSYDGVAEFHISIVNRWGNLITEYNDPGAAWDGRNMNGEVVSEGTYFYKFNAKLQTGEEIEQQGFVQVFH